MARLFKVFPFVFAALLLLGFILAGAQVDLVVGRVRLAPIGWSILMGALGCGLGLVVTAMNLLVVKKEKPLFVAIVIAPITILMFFVFRAMFIGLLADAAAAP